MNIKIAKCLTKEQCGFRRNHSTLDALSTIHIDTRTAFRKNQYLITVALNIQKTYSICN